MMNFRGRAKCKIRCESNCVIKFKSYLMLQRIGGKSKAAGKAPKVKEHDEETINELKEAFKIFDSKNTGTT